jgi:putative transposase
LKGVSSYRLFKLHPELKERYWGGSLWSSGKFFRSVGNVTADTIAHYIKESQGKRKQRINYACQRILGNEDLMISEFRKTGRAARSIPRPLGRGGRAQFDIFTKI